MAKKVEVFWRNTGLYIREVVECGEQNVIFDKGYLIKKRIDANKFMDLNYMGRPFKLRIVESYGVTEFNSESNDLKAVYPAWEYGDDPSVLEEFLLNPPGKDMAACNNKTIPRGERPVFGQDNIVYITEPPDMGSKLGKKFLSDMRDLQSDYPQSTLVIHGTYSVYAQLGMGFKSIDFEVRGSSALGKLHLPTGRVVNVKSESLVPYVKWLTMLGYVPKDMTDARKRCLYNIKALNWASENYNSIKSIAFRNTSEVDTTISDEEYEAPIAGKFITKSNLVMEPGDKYVCNSCSLMYACKLYREGAVCSLPRSEPGQLAKYFGTRNANDIIDGLGALVQINAGRAAAGVESEEDFGLDPTVTKIIDDTFRQGTKLAQLIDPSLRNPKLQINVGSGGKAAIVTQDMSTIVAGAMRELEQAGFKREDITPDMISGVLDKSGHLKALESGQEPEPVYDAEIVND